MSIKLLARIFMLCAMCAFVSGCETTSSQYRPQAPAQDRVTVGTVQRFIGRGMYSYEVVQVLGAPNMVSKDRNGNETWVYDKIHSEYERRESDGGLSLGIGGGGVVGLGVLGGGLGIGGHSAKASASSSERTLTIVIHFDSESRVSDFSYRTTSF